MAARKASRSCGTALRGNFGNAPSGKARTPQATEQARLAASLVLSAEMHDLVVCTPQLEAFAERQVKRGSRQQAMPSRKAHSGGIFQQAGKRANTENWKALSSRHGVEDGLRRHKGAHRQERSGITNTILSKTLKERCIRRTKSRDGTA